MIQRKIILIISITGALIVAAALWHLHFSSPPVAPAQSTPAQFTPAPSPKLPLLHASQSTGTDEYQQLSLKTMSLDEAMRKWFERGMKDHDADFKVSINFYGKVVDENNKPVSNANAFVSWETPDGFGGKEESMSGFGTKIFRKEKIILSDANGLFSLTGQRGGRIQVNVQKDGYYSVESDKRIPLFEFGDPSSADYYEPDPNNPVVFHLRKKGAGAKLFSKSLLIYLKDKRLDARVNLMQGYIKPDGVLHLTLDGTKSLPSGAFPWSAAVDMSEGGMVETNEQYPFEAPQSGYNTKSATVDMSNLDKKTWDGGWVKTYYFYLPSTNTYGRMKISFAANLGVTVDYSYNPTPGDRNLEPASQ